MDVDKVKVERETPRIVELLVAVANAECVVQWDPDEDCTDEDPCINCERGHAASQILNAIEFKQ
jgi:hypothetical protein